MSLQNDTFSSQGCPWISVVPPTLLQQRSRKTLNPKPYTPEAPPLMFLREVLLIDPPRHVFGVREP